MTTSLDLILPFLEPIARLIEDPTVTEIMVNGNGAIFLERGGRLERVDATIEQRVLSQAVKRIARSARISAKPSRCSIADWPMVLA